jgi:tetratricopeptide (TPR) repeat protein
MWLGRAGRSRQGEEDGVRQWDLVSGDFARASLAADEVPAGAARLRAHEDVLRMAIGNASFPEEFVARNDLVSAVLDTSDDTVALPHVSWLAAALTGAHPLDAEDVDAVLWKLEWALDVAEGSPEVPLDRWRSAVDDLAVGHRAAGRGDRAVHAARARLAHATGDDASRDEAIARWRAAPTERDGEDCPACETHDLAILVRSSGPDAVLQVLAPVLSGELTCDGEPDASHALAAESRAMLGDVDAAAHSFRQAWHGIADDPTRAVEVAAGLRALVRIGNTDRAVDLLLPRLGWLDALPEPVDRMWWAGTAAWVLENGLRLGLAPESVGDRPTDRRVAELRATAADEAVALDARAGSTVLADELSDALAADPVADEPTLPPTRLTPGPGPAAAFPLDQPFDVVPLADAVAAAVNAVDPQATALVRAWGAQREDLAARLDAPDQWAAAAFLDRHAAQDLPYPERRPLLEGALAAAERAGDEVGAARTRCDLRVLEVMESGQVHHSPAAPEVVTARETARAAITDLEGWAPPEEAAAAWRRFAHDAWAPDPSGACLHAAGLYERAGLPARRALCVLEAGLATVPHDHAAALRLIDEGERLAGDTLVLRALAVDLRARIARVEGDLQRALQLLEAEHAMRGLADEVRAGPLFTCCDVLVDLGDWERLEVRAADAVALALRLRDPVALAVGQRLLGLAWLETGRPAEAAELLEAALPVIHEHVPALTGPSGWALGNACVSIGRWGTARTAFAAAAEAFAAAQRLEEAAHSHLRAAHAAWDDDDRTAAVEHYEQAAASARVAGSPEVLVEALRGSAELRALGGDVDGALTALDSALGEGERLASLVRAGPGADFDAEVLEPDVLHEGALILARAGRTEQAVERLARAAALVGGDHEIAMRSEIGIVLADADRLGEAGPLLHAAIAELDAAGLAAERDRAAAALAGGLERAGRLEEAAHVRSVAGPPVTVPTDR